MILPFVQADRLHTIWEYPIVNGKKLSMSEIFDVIGPLAQWYGISDIIKWLVSLPVTKYDINVMYKPGTHQYIHHFVLKTTLDADNAQKYNELYLLYKLGK